MSETVVHNQHGCEIKMLDDSSTNSRTKQQDIFDRREGEVSKILIGGRAGAGIYLIYKGCHSGEEKRGVRKCMGGMVQGN